MPARRVHVMSVLTVGAVALWASAATAVGTPPDSGRIGPRQVFVGLVNGSTGATAPAQIRVACAGPVEPGETTHPLAHQPLEVEPPSAVDANVGRTGRFATHISAFVGIPPAATDASGIATFRYYGVRKPIPTTLNVPCSGSGYITFMPLPRDPGRSRAFVVPVEYVNIAV
jgi:hypothetical protein